MGKPKIIGYKDEFTGPIGGTLGCADASEMQFVRRRPIYKERPYRVTPTHDGCQLNGWKLYCKRCKTATMSRVRLPYELAANHRCLYNPEEINDVAS